MPSKDVAYALSTWKKSNDFNAALKELATEIPLTKARTYLVYGIKDEHIPEAIYDKIDELQELRRSAIIGEMKYVAAQAHLYSKEDPELAVEVIKRNNLASVLTGEAVEDVDKTVRAALKAAVTEDERADESSATAILLFGEDVIAGDSIRFGFGSEDYELAPSLGVYELFIWFDVDELSCEVLTSL